MSIRKEIALWLWPGIEHSLDEMRSTRYDQGFEDGHKAALEQERHRAVLEQADPKEESKPEPVTGSARDVAGYSAKQAAEDIKAALKRLNEETGGMSAEVDTYWRTYQFLNSETPHSALDSVTVTMGGVRAQA